MTLLITKYNLSSKLIQMLIFFLFYFICLKLHYCDYNFLIAECTNEHPLNKQKTVLNTEFAPAKTSSTLGTGHKPGPKYCIEKINHVKDLKPFLKVNVYDWHSNVEYVSKKDLQIYDNSCLISWAKGLHTEIPNKLGGLVYKNGRWSYDVYSHFQFYGCNYDETIDPDIGNYRSKHREFFETQFAVSPARAHVSRDIIIDILKNRGFIINITNVVSITK